MCDGDGVGERASFRATVPLSLPPTHPHPTPGRRRLAAAAVVHRAIGVFHGLSFSPSLSGSLCFHLARACACMRPRSRPAPSLAVGGCVCVPVGTLLPASACARSCRYLCATRASLSVSHVLFSRAPGVFKGAHQTPLSARAGGWRLHVLSTLHRAQRVQGAGGGSVSWLGA